MARTRRDPSTLQSTQVGVRVTSPEKIELAALIARAEEAAGLVPGSITAANYIRSLVVKHLAERRKVGALVNTAVHGTDGHGSKTATKHRQSESS
jgi:hypothetical protein